MYFRDGHTKRFPDYLILRTPKSVLNFVFRGVSRNVLRHIHHLRIQFDFNYDACDYEHEIWSIAIGIVLRILPELKDLVLLWSGAPSRVFRGVPFQLEALTSTVEVDEEALLFLHSQPQLRLVELPHWRTVEFTNPSFSHRKCRYPISFGRKILRSSYPLINPQSYPLSLFSDETFLPNLCELSVPPLTAQMLVPGRPVRSVDIRLTRGERVRNWDALTRAFSQSTCPMDDLAIATLDEFSFEMLDSLRWLPSLMTLYVRVLAPARVDSVSRTIVSFFFLLSRHP
ncbi:uncharacterized protein EI90DRAFT_2104510 [Cantharellus anzutake]|uniref:uncharacterized protein n=1 Tax=Cantharellus anzutake TaxID=1750568 RepID=UPI001905CCBD|nr:uncharacterized protein EI90DRAFT_2104510 [Cantharellus anzutake]KAF8340737.1 hypothetical protein EI90DRAFT_2104510 [Cantharellus anzutake]